MGMLTGGFFSQPSDALTQALSTTINSSSATVYTSTKEIITDLSTYINTYFYTAYGFDAGSDYFAYGLGFGSIASGTYTDGNSNSRTVDSCYFLEGSADPRGQDNLFFVLDTTSVPNTNSTFFKIVIDGNEYLRSDAFYVASVDGGTSWNWTFSPSGTNPFLGANPDDFEVWTG